jgi:hypothetical protein
MKPSAKMISGAMAAEAALAKEDAKELEKAIDELPEGHPLKMAAAAQKEALGGDLAGLPPHHPLLLAMEEARLRYEISQEEVDDGLEEQEQISVRRARKLDEKKAVRAARRQEDEREERLRTATKRINLSMTETMDSLKQLVDNIAASQEDFAGDRYAMMKLERLSRILVAAMRGVSESRLNAGRMVSNG